MPKEPCRRQYVYRKILVSPFLDVSFGGTDEILARSRELTVAL
jgi:hypothetical protein